MSVAYSTSEQCREVVKLIDGTISYAIRIRITSYYVDFFFFSSRRRHTRFDCDWSSDVCSSDLAVFSTLTIERAGAGYTLQASATTGTGATLSGSSATFAITPGAATHLVFSVQPVTTAAGAAITPAVQVTARDALENTATGFTGNVTVTLAAKDRKSTRLN